MLVPVGLHLDLRGFEKYDSWNCVPKVLTTLYYQPGNAPSAKHLPYFYTRRQYMSFEEHTHYMRSPP